MAEFGKVCFTAFGDDRFTVEDGEFVCKVTAGNGVCRKDHRNIGRRPFGRGQGGGGNIHGYKGSARKARVSLGFAAGEAVYRQVFGVCKCVGRDFGGFLRNEYLFRQAGIRKCLRFDFFDSRRKIIYGFRMRRGQAGKTQSCRQYGCQYATEFLHASSVFVDGYIFNNIIIHSATIRNSLK